MASILDTIVATKREEVALAKKATSIHALEKKIEARIEENYSLAAALREAPGIIAEFKRASPSKGIIHEAASVCTVVSGYDNSGAAGISVLTDRDYFQAQPDDFVLARESASKPLLRKEFIIDAYQLYESKAMGANVVLLIAAILSKDEILNLTKQAHALGLEVLLELHDVKELTKVSGEEDLIGVNNRNLNTFQVDISQSAFIRKELGNPDLPMVSESGLSSSKEIDILLDEGFKGFLMGEFFMKQKDPVQAFQKFKSEFDSVRKRYA